MGTYELITAATFRRDETLSWSERGHALALLMAHSSGIEYVMGVDDESAIRQGVPPPIRYRAMLHAALHKSAMCAAIYFAICKAGDEEAGEVAQALADAYRDLILKQLPASRGVVAKLEQPQ